MSYCFLFDRPGRLSTVNPDKHRRDGGSIELADMKNVQRLIVTRAIAIKVINDMFSQSGWQSLACG